MPKIKIQSNFCIDHENNIQKIDIYAMNDHIEINEIKDDEPLANYVDEEFIFNLLGILFKTKIQGIF